MSVDDFEPMSDDWFENLNLAHLTPNEKFDFFKGALKWSVLTPMKGDWVVWNLNFFELKEKNKNKFLFFIRTEWACED